MQKNTPIDIDAYIAGCPAEVQEILTAIRETIREEAPHAKEVISYGIPTYKFNKTMVSIAAFKNHCSFFPGYTVQEFLEELKDYKTSTGTIQFSTEEPIPEELVRSILKARFCLS